MVTRFRFLQNKYEEIKLYLKLFYFGSNIVRFKHTIVVVLLFLFYFQQCTYGSISISNPILLYINVYDNIVLKRVTLFRTLMLPKLYEKGVFFYY